MDTNNPSHSICPVVKKNVVTFSQRFTKRLNKPILPIWLNKNWPYIWPYKPAIKPLPHFFTTELLLNAQNPCIKRFGMPRTGLSHLEVPHDPVERDYKNCKDWITIDLPHEIECLLHEQNICHFGQTHGTFPIVPNYSKEP